MWGLQQMKANSINIKVRFYASLSQVFQEKERDVQLEEKTTIRSLLNLLCNTDEHREEIFDKFGQISSSINILRNGRHISFLNGIETELEEGDRIAIFPLLYGG